MKKLFAMLLTLALSLSAPRGLQLRPVGIRRALR